MSIPDDLQITVAVCTFNRADSLRKTLESMVALDPPLPWSWELLLIDNNSTDHTREVAEQFSDPLPLRYVFEAEQGLSAARNRAMRECRTNALVFTDDDVVLDHQWLSHYVTAFRQWPDADYFGGKIKPLWHNNRPTWLRDESMALLSGFLGNYDLGTENRPYTEQDLTPFGANFALRRRLFDNLTPFRTELGVKGSIPGRGEEADYLARARAAGFTGVYVGSALCLHTIDTQRFTLSYLYRYGIQKGIAAVRMDSRPPPRSPHPAQEFWFAVRGINQLLKGRGDRFRQCVINMGIQRGLRQAMREESGNLG